MKSQTRIMIMLIACLTLSSCASNPYRPPQEAESHAVIHIQEPSDFFEPPVLITGINGYPLGLSWTRREQLRITPGPTNLDVRASRQDWRGSNNLTAQLSFVAEADAQYFLGCRDASENSVLFYLRAVDSGAILADNLVTKEPPTAGDAASSFIGKTLESIINNGL